MCVDVCLSTALVLLLSILQFAKLKEYIQMLKFNICTTWKTHPSFERALLERHKGFCSLKSLHILTNLGSTSQSLFYDDGDICMVWYLQALPLALAQLSAQSSCLVGAPSEALGTSVTNIDWEIASFSARRFFPDLSRDIVDFFEVIFSSDFCRFFPDLSRDIVDFFSIFSKGEIEYFCNFLSLSIYCRCIA